MNEVQKLVKELETHPFEFKRLTGRTTRMMEAAKAMAESGKPVVVVFKDEHNAKFWRDKYDNVPGLSVVPMKVKMPELDWESMKFSAGPYAHHKTFIDHDVIYLWNRHLFDAYCEYDRPLDHSPYTTPQRHAA